MSLKVAIIDDGISNEKYKITAPLHHIISLNGKTYYDKIHQIDPNSHGSCCAAILCKYLECPVEIYSIQVLQNDLGNCMDFLNAILWCTANNINLINMSIGTVDIEDGRIIENYINNSGILKHLVIVAAQSNKNIYTYPASLPGIIGVKSEKNYRNSRIEVIDESSDHIELKASAIHAVKLTNDSTKVIFGGNSFATPLVTSRVCSILNTHGIISKEKILSIIKHNYSINGE